MGSQYWLQNTSCKVHHKIVLAVLVFLFHYGDVIMGAIASQITSLTIVYSTFYSDTDQRKHQSSTVTGLCVGNSSGTGEFPAQMVRNAEYVSIWWRHRVVLLWWGVSGCHPYPLSISFIRTGSVCSVNEATLRCKDKQITCIHNKW